MLRDEIVLQLDLLASYERQIAAVEARMEEAFLDAPEAEALLSIPRLGTVMAAPFLGALGDPRAYEKSRQALRVAGLSLTVHESGRRHGKPYLSKRGRPELRRQAYMFAVRSVSRGGMYRSDFERPVANNGGRKIPALVALTRQAIRLMYSVAVDRRLYTPERPW